MTSLIKQNLTAFRLYENKLTPSAGDRREKERERREREREREKERDITRA